MADSDEEKLLIVQNSIMNGWVGFFPLNQDEKKQLRDKSSYDIDEYMKTMDTFGSEPKGDPKRFPFELGNWL